MAIPHIPPSALKRNMNGHRFAPTIPDCICKHCGKTYHPKRSDRTTYCSRECGWLAQKASAISEEELERRRLERVARKKKGPFKLMCVQCRGCFASNLSISRYCSKECRRAGWIRPKINRKCIGCGAEIIGTKAKRMCRRCCTSTASARRRALERSHTMEHVNPFFVFRRDRWLCQLCGNKTDHKLRGTYEPHAPELDHIIPISKGGSHSYANTQCACRKCNIAKGNKVPQLAHQIEQGRGP